MSPEGDSHTEIYLRNNPNQRGNDLFQAEIGYAGQPQRDRHGNLFVSAEVRGSQLGISAINLRCELLRDYFYAANRRQPWDRQPTFYELLRVNPRVSPAELRASLSNSASSKIALLTDRLGNSVLF